MGELKERLEQREHEFKKLTAESDELHRTNQSLKQYKSSPMFLLSIFPCF